MSELTEPNTWKPHGIKIKVHGGKVCLKSCEQCTEMSPLPHHSESSIVKAKHSKPSESQVDGGGVNDGVLELI